MAGYDSMQVKSYGVGTIIAVAAVTNQKSNSNNNLYGIESKNGKQTEPLSLFVRIILMNKLNEN